MGIKSTLKRGIERSRMLSFLYDKIYYPYVLWKRCKISIRDYGSCNSVDFPKDTYSNNFIITFRGSNNTVKVGRNCTFKRTNSDIAVIINEYALVVGIITLNDVMSTVMGDLVLTPEESQIVERDENSWLVDGATPTVDLVYTLELDELPDSQNYETVAGFMMYMLRKIPKRTDRIDWSGYRFEVIDVDANKVDQVLVTRLKGSEPPKAALDARPS